MRVDKKISSKNLRERVKECLAGKVDVQLGKNGITEEFIREVKNRLEKHGVVKVRVLKSARKTLGVDVEKLAENIAERTRSQVCEVRGFTFILKASPFTAGMKYKSL
jgi:RNA-binding protein